MKKIFIKKKLLHKSITYSHLLKHIESGLKDEKGI